MNVFMDFEFLEDGFTIDPISVGMVTDTGKELYLINKDANWDKIHQHDWLMKNVVNQLTDDQSFWVTKQEMALKVLEFLLEDKYNLNLFAWFAAYDHVALAQLFGTMMQFPTGIPMYTHDLRSMLDWFNVPSWKIPKKSDKIHNALEDAKWNYELYKVIVGYKNYLLSRKVF